ncbi:MAG: polymer-forming cytoskeletal protein [Lachnospiraceae bacterium]|nr:polymer-forming cytoskeletal protein [Lachnospiraceae bacterium]
MMSKNRNKNASADTRAKVGTLIGKGAVFDGNLTAPETIRLDGTLNGNCECKELLIVGVDGYINGDIDAQNVMIAGRVDGDIVAHGKLELLSTGKLTGNITARSLVIDEDACFDGRCTMTSPDTAGTSVSTKSDKNSKSTLTDTSDKETQNTTTAGSGQKSGYHY